MRVRLEREKGGMEGIPKVQGTKTKVSRSNNGNVSFPINYQLNNQFPSRQL